MLGGGGREVRGVGFRSRCGLSRWPTVKAVEEAEGVRGWRG